MHCKSVILALVLLMHAVCGNCQNPNEQQQPVKYSPQQLREDYSVLIKALETMYPSLDRFTDESVIKRYLDDRLKSLNQPASEVEFYKVVAMTCARLGDEHLIPSPSKDYYLSLENARHYFPFSLKIIDRRVYVLTASQADSAIPVGSEILSINGRPVEDILSTLLPAIPADGYIQTFKTRHLEDYSMTEVENLFDLNYPIFVEDADSYRIEFVEPGNTSKKKTATVAGLDYKAYKRYYQGRVSLAAPLQFKFLQSNVAYLRISSFLRWHRARFKQDFDVLYDSIFKELNSTKTENLILDLRNNEGGDGTGEKLLTYLLTSPYRHFEAIEQKFVGYPPVLDYVQNGEDLFFDESLVYQTSSGMYRLKKEHHDQMPLLDEQKPNANHYNGNLYVLINGASGSMASVVASFLRGNGRGVFIGEEGGATMEGNTSHRTAHLVLPNSHIRIDIPLIKTTNAVAFEKGRGVRPDYVVIPAIADILKGVDAELNFALGLISSSK